MGEEIITYPKIREIQREERTKPSLTKLPPNFVDLIKNYLDEKKAILDKNRDNNNLFSRDMYSRADYELKNAYRSIENIFLTREKKIIDKAFQIAKNELKVRDTTNMLDFEKELFNNIVNILESYHQGCIISLLNSQKPKMSKKEKILKIEEDSSKDNKLIRIKEPIPAFLWEGGRKLGPFKAEDIVQLPSKVAELLVKQKRAEEVRK